MLTEGETNRGDQAGLGPSKGFYTGGSLEAHVYMNSDDICELFVSTRKKTVWNSFSQFVSKKSITSFYVNLSLSKIKICPNSAR